MCPGNGLWHTLSFTAGNFTTCMLSNLHFHAGLQCRTLGHTDGMRAIRSLAADPEYAAGSFINPLFTVHFDMVSASKACFVGPEYEPSLVRSATMLEWSASRAAYTPSSLLQYKQPSPDQTAFNSKPGPSQNPKPHHFATAEEMKCNRRLKLAAERGDDLTSSAAECAQLGTVSSMFKRRK
eukprot:SAG31_NODE_2500_length_5595_cov_4.571143_3_plen_181_part_00